MVEMKVVGLALDEVSQVPILILKDKDEKKVLPIWIGAMEAVAISLVLNNVKLPRPMTHDLLLQAILQLGGDVQRVVISDLKEGTYYARIDVGQGDSIVGLDSRPSDAIALALRADVPIYAMEQVLDQVEIVKKDEYQIGLSGDEAKEWTDILTKFSPNDTKYKM